MAISEEIVQAELLNLLEEKTEPAAPCQIVTGQ
jgi:hypothetical protein